MKRKGAKILKAAQAHGYDHTWEPYIRSIMERGYLGTEAFFGVTSPCTAREWACNLAITIAWRITTWDYGRAAELMRRYRDLYWEAFEARELR